MTTEEIKYVISDVGADKVAGDFGKVATSIGGAEKASGSFNAKVAGTSMVVQDLGMALGRGNPKIMEFTNVVAGARSSLMGLTAALGGPAGLAAGVIAAGAVAGVELFARAQADAAEETKRATEALVEQQAAISKLNAELSRAAGIDGGTTAADLRARIASSGATGANRQRLELLAGYAEEREGKASYEAERSAALAEIRAAEASLGGGGRGGGARSPLGDSSNDFMSMAEQRRLAEKRLAGGGKGDLDTFLAEQAKAGDFEIAEANRIETERTRILEEQAAERERIHEQEMEIRRKAHEESSQMLVNAGAVGAAAIGKQLAAVSRGQKASLKVVLGTIGEAAVGEGTMGVFRAAMMATNPLTAGAAPGHLAASLAMIAGGMALGAASASGGKSGASAGGGISTSRPITQSGGGGDGGGTTYINVNMSSVVSPGPDDGVRVVQALERANAVHGTTVSKRMVQAA